MELKIDLTTDNPALVAKLVRVARAAALREIAQELNDRADVLDAVTEAE